MSQVQLKQSVVRIMDGKYGGLWRLNEGRLSNGFGLEIDAGEVLSSVALSKVEADEIVVNCNLVDGTAFDACLAPSVLLKLLEILDSKGKPRSTEERIELYEAALKVPAEPSDQASVLEEYAGFLKSNNLRLLDAANLQARAKAVRQQNKLPAPDLNVQANVREKRNDEKQCPYCAEVIKEEARICKHCRSDLGARGSSQNVVVVGSGPSRGIAVLLSFFIPGAGSIYAGAIGQGFVIMLVTIVISVMSLGLGYFFMWIIGMIAAHASATARQQGGT